MGTYSFTEWLDTFGGLPEPGDSVYPDDPDALRDELADHASVAVRIENDYEDGHHSERTVHLPAPEGELEDWWEETVFDHTGDGHGIGNKLGSCYTATIVAASDEALVGESHEWC